jgi:hypothetical protein
MNKNTTEISLTELHSIDVFRNLAELLVFMTVINRWVPLQHQISLGAS